MPEYCEHCSDMEFESVVINGVVRLRCSTCGTLVPINKSADMPLLAVA